MIIRSFIFIIFLSLAVNVVNAQSPGRRWAKLFDSEEKTIYMDTTSIRQIDNQLSVWSLLIYSQPQQKEKIDKEVKKIKTQYLINTLTKRYSIIGSLFYDERGRIVGESSIARFGGSNELTQMVADNPMVSLVMDAAKSYNETGIVTSDNSDTDSVENYNESNEDIPDDVTDYNRDIENNNSVENDTVVEDNSTPDTSEPESTDNDYSTDNSNENQQNSSQPYNVQAERSAGSMIFTDGNIYVIQVSAWRSRPDAESAVRKLKNRGHNAFITEAYIPQKGGTWYRVRVGYFKSYNEARNYKRAM